MSMTIDQDFPAKASYCNTGSRGVLFARISSKCTIVARIDLLLIQIAASDRAVNMRFCYTSVEILSAQMIGARRATIPESEAFRTRHEVYRTPLLPVIATHIFVTLRGVQSTRFSHPLVRRVGLILAFIHVKI